MNIRKFKLLRRKSFLGKLLRLPFKLIPGKTVLKILSGPLSGQRWIKGSHNLSVILGTYERVQSKQFFIHSTGVKVFWDLGAHVGYYTLLFRAANAIGEIVAFEPLPFNAHLLNRHMELNRISGVVRHCVAVSNLPGSLSFSKGKTTVAGRLAVTGEEHVDVVRLSDWVKEKKLKVPQLIKMDIEGEEYKVLQDIEFILKDYKPVVFLSTHGKDIHLACVSLLTVLHYKLKPLDAADVENCRELLAY